MLTAKRLREALAYDASTGIFTWRISTNRKIVIGAVAGTKTRGYIRIRVDGVVYAAHRLAWLYVHGEWPAKGLDHRDRVRCNNRVSNLREATPRTNNRNRLAAHPVNPSGIIGAAPFRNGYRARIRVNGRDTYLGTFPTPAEANKAYLVAKATAHAGDFQCA